MDPPSLMADALDAHRDALEVERVADLCRRAAGQRLLELRRELGPGRWQAWLNRECPIPKATVGRYMKAAGR